ncbi:MAG: hypothetical protein EBQ89_09945 [Alphaproteobacteria bacterium]|nr:hypothetical protein [Alphaproteobacteria bacterium]
MTKHLLCLAAFFALLLPLSALSQSDNMVYSKVGSGKPYNLPTRHMGITGCGGQIVDCKQPDKNLVMSIANSCISVRYSGLTISDTKKMGSNGALCAYSKGSRTDKSGTSYRWPVCCVTPQSNGSTCEVICHAFFAEEKK